MNTGQNLRCALYTQVCVNQTQMESIRLYIQLHGLLRYTRTHTALIKVSGRAPLCAVSLRFPRCLSSLLCVPARPLGCRRGRRGSNPRSQLNTMRRAAHSAIVPWSHLATRRWGGGKRERGGTRLEPLWTSKQLVKVDFSPFSRVFTETHAHTVTHTTI